MPGIGYIGFHDQINTNTANQLLAATQQLISQHDVDHVYYLFSTPGGEVQSGIRVYNSIKSLPIETTMHNMGNIDSIGNAIFLAANNRIACPHSTFMFHGVALTLSTQTKLERKGFQEGLDSLLADELKISGIIADETDLTGDELNNLFVQATTKDAKFARSHGIIGEIRMPDIDSSRPYFHLVIQ